MATYTELQDAIIEMQEQIESLTENLNKTQQQLERLKGWKGNTPELEDDYLGIIEKYFKSKDKSKTSLFNIFVIEQEILGIISKAKQSKAKEQ